MKRRYGYYSIKIGADDLATAAIAVGVVAAGQ